ncbi:hypothetical protein [Erythrobacter insulae]|uniref:hypothetical protein n=1 Tax=Erythrobacter insulae TaxID=2584124 RepID=UPI00163D694C|nr:hypothetical protein [Erythrobacter insulae]
MDSDETKGKGASGSDRRVRDRREKQLSIDAEERRQRDRRSGDDRRKEPRK